MGRKWAKAVNREFTEKETQMIYKYMKRRFTLLTVRGLEK